MAFEAMNQLNHQVIHERSCMMIYGFNPQEMKHIQNISRMTGIKDCIIIGKEETQTVLKEILDGNMTKSEPKTLAKTIVFNQIPSSRINAFIEGIKKCRMARPLIAVVTETSINWTFDELINHLQEERRAVSANRFSEHE